MGPGALIRSEVREYLVSELGLDPFEYEDFMSVICALDDVQMGLWSKATEEATR